MTRVLRRRLLEFLRMQQLEQEAVSAGLFESFEDALASYEEDWDSLLIAIERYKTSAWRGKFDCAYGAGPIVDAKDLGKHGRGVDRKAAIMNAWRLNQEFGSCAYCGIPLRIAEMTEDHVIPRSCGGTSEIVNLVPCCHDCNQDKKSRSAEQFLLDIGYTQAESVQLIDAWKSEDRRSVPGCFSWRLSKDQKQNLGLDDRQPSRDEQ